MNKDRQFLNADAAIERTVTTFFSAIDRMGGRWRDVAYSYILEGVVLKLCEELTKRIDAEPDLALGPATLKLSNALADYRDSQER